MSPVERPPSDSPQVSSSPVGASGSYMRSGPSGFSGGRSGCASLAAGVVVFGSVAALLYGGWQLLKWMF
jgi:hypothetical protein